MTFTLFPAIDLKDGKCVRLVRGEMDKATVFSENPVKQAQAFVEAGFKWLHVVDLNGAFAGRPINEAAVKDILRGVKTPVQLGGGIRSMKQIEDWFKVGISRVILGTIALKNPKLVKEASRLFPGQIAVGIDAKDGKVAVEGWAEVSNLSAAEVGRRFEDVGVTAIVYTDIARDGLMQGPNIEETVKLAEAVGIPVIASGGISSVDDIRRFKRLSGKGIKGCVLGRALYEGAIDVDAALRLC